MSEIRLKKEDQIMLERAMNGIYIQPKTIELRVPIELRCPHCGRVSRVSQVILQCWPEREREKGGLVAVCSFCGCRKQVQKNEKKQTQDRTWLAACVLVLLLLVGIVGGYMLWHPDILVHTVLGQLGNNVKDEPEEPDQPTVTNKEPVRESKSHYTVHYADVTWDQAEEACEADYYNDVTGHLAVITSEEEYEEVVSILEDYIADHPEAEKMKYVWIGGWIYDEDAENGVMNYHWITDEPWSFSHWCSTTSDEGKRIVEPSYYDDGLNLIENRLILWGYQHEKIGWTFSDQNGDLPEVYPPSMGEIGYICEFEWEE